MGYTFLAILVIAVTVDKAVTAEVCDAAKIGKCLTGLQADIEKTGINNIDLCPKSLSKSVSDCKSCVAEETYQQFLTDAKIKCDDGTTSKPIYTGKCTKGDAEQTKTLQCLKDAKAPLLKVEEEAKKAGKQPDYKPVLCKFIRASFECSTSCFTFDKDFDTENALYKGFKNAGYDCGKEVIPPQECSAAEAKQCLTSIKNVKVGGTSLTDKDICTTVDSARTTCKSCVSKVQFDTFLSDANIKCEGATGKPIFAVTCTKLEDLAKVENCMKAANKPVDDAEAAAAKEGKVPNYKPVLCKSIRALFKCSTSCSTFDQGFDIENALYKGFEKAGYDCAKEVIPPECSANEAKACVDSLKPLPLPSSFTDKDLCTKVDSARTTCKSCVSTEQFDKYLGDANIKCKGATGKNIFEGTCTKQDELVNFGVCIVQANKPVAEAEAAAKDKEVPNYKSVLCKSAKAAFQCEKDCGKFDKAFNIENALYDNLKKAGYDCGGSASVVSSVLVVTLMAFLTMFSSK